MVLWLRMTDQFQEQANELAIALEWGLADLDEVVRRADSVMAANDEFEPNLIDISLATNLAEALAALNQFLPGPHSQSGLSSLFKRILAIEPLAPDQACRLAQRVFNLASSEGASDELSRLVGHWDYIQLAIDGILGDPEEEVAKFLNGLSEYIHKVENG